MLTNLLDSFVAWYTLSIFLNKKKSSEKLLISFDVYFHPWVRFSFKKISNNSGIVKALLVTLIM